MSLFKLWLRKAWTWLVLAGGIGGAVGLTLSPEEASREFYSAAVGIIPVLLLTLAVQARFFELPRIQQVLALLRLPEREPGESSAGYTRRALENFEAAQASAGHLLDRAMFGLLLLGLLVTAEFVALHPLASGRPENGNPEVVYVALVTGFLMIGGLAVLGGIEARQAYDRAGRSEGG